ncbi:muts domain V-domain-containing protein [Leucosporidium creatinivorum]|uniref:Muts domain V-domain-containing protein n=1 Tax=Leucosporidium creatinivorum TaxID=106004 RepID=A0A1Y2DIH8_9BASI|nr:muts domain V-domain-containing protein [Leucosporidium creatinivorum]
MSIFPGSISNPAPSTRAASHSGDHSPSLRASHIHTPTPQYSPPPDEYLRKVHWGSPEFFSQAQSQEGEQKAPTEVKGEALPQDQSQQEEEEEGWNGQGRESVLAVTAMKGQVGCCYYDGQAGKLFFLEDQRDSASWDLTNIVLEQLLPSTVLTSANADSNFLTSLQETLASLPVSSTSSSSGLSTSDSNPSVHLEYRPPREFYAGQGRNALTQLQVVEGGIYEAEERGTMGEESAGDSSGDESEKISGSGGRRDAYEFGRRKKGRRGGERAGDLQGDRARRNGVLRLESFLNGLGASPLTLGCAGALLGHISRSMSGAGELEVDGGLSVAGIELMHLDKVMHINSDALASLQIFTDESHASMHSAKTKEGILNIARTPLGRLLMRNWFLRPSLELEVIEARHAAVECFLRSENQHVADAIQANFRTVKNAPKKIRTLANGRGGIPDWQTVWQFLYSAIMIRDAALSLVHRRGVEVVERLLASFDADKFKALGNMMNDVIDWEESSLAGRVSVKSGIDPGLDELRRTYAGLPSLLSRVADEIGCEIPPDFSATLSVVYFPQLGYLINIPYSDGVTDPERCEAIGWQFQFVTEQFAYFKSDKCTDLDRHLGDIHSFILDKEIEIFQSLLSHLLDQEADILATCDVLAELDCLLAFAEAARLYHWNRPNMTEEPVCRIIGGRHPLVELCVDSFVKNDLALRGGQGAAWGAQEDVKPDLEALDEPEYLDPNRSMLIVTGANYSGKSIFLKQIALITFMAHLGSFVPAERAQIGITDRILTRVSTRESITRGSSAFMIDLQQISFALRNATARSLLIIDEYGKGTESDDGAGLFCAVMEHLISRGEDTPRIAVATHFHSEAEISVHSHIFANSFISKSLPISYAHMEILIHDSTNGSSVASSADSNLTYLYRLRPSLALTSHAAACASQFGIPSTILNRANSISTALLKFDIDSILNEALTEEEEAELKEGEVVGRRLLEWEMGDEEWGDEEVGREEVRRKLEWVLGIEDKEDEAGGE